MNDRQVKSFVLRLLAQRQVVLHGLTMFSQISEPGVVTRTLTGTTSRPVRTGDILPIFGLRWIVKEVEFKVRADGKPVYVITAVYTGTSAEVFADVLPVRFRV